MEKKTKTVLSFEQSGDFYQRRAALKADRQSYLDAVGFLRKAIEREPGNSEYRLDLADIYTRMCCYEESNRVLVSMMRLGGASPECFFGMGCNFYAMREFGNAREAFETYRRLEPEGEFSEAVEDMLVELDEDWDEELPAAVAHLVQRGRRALEGGNYQQALSLLEKVLGREPELHQARNSLALAAFCAGDAARALRETRRVLAAEPGDLHANCNMALLLAERGQKKKAGEFLSRAMEAPLEEIEDMYKVCFTLCEMGRDQEALENLKKFLSVRPYDKRALHYFAVANFNLGDYDQAISAWNRARRIAPENPVAAFCLARAKRAKAGEEVSRMPYYDQLPAAEVRRRVAEFSGRLGGSREEIAQRFVQEEEFRELVYWGLGVPDENFRRMALRLLSFVGGQTAEDMLRDYLLRLDESEDLKREAMGYLKALGAKEPYLAMFGGCVVEVRVSVMQSDVALTPGQQEVVRLAVAALPQELILQKLGREEAAARLFTLWEEFLRGRDLRVRKPEAWAAALVLLLCEGEGLPLSRAAVARVLEVSPAAVGQCLKKLRDGREGGS